MINKVGTALMQMFLEYHGLFSWVQSSNIKLTREGELQRQREVATHLRKLRGGLDSKEPVNGC